MEQLTSRLSSLQDQGAAFRAKLAPDPALQKEFDALLVRYGDLLLHYGVKEDPVMVVPTTLIPKRNIFVASLEILDERGRYLLFREPVVEGCNKELLWRHFRCQGVRGDPVASTCLDALRRIGLPDATFSRQWRSLHYSSGLRVYHLSSKGETHRGCRKRQLVPL